MPDKITVPRFRASDYYGETPKEKRIIFLKLMLYYVQQSAELAQRAMPLFNYHQAAHILAQAAYAIRQAAAVERELDHMDNATNDNKKGEPQK